MSESNNQHVSASQTADTIIETANTAPENERWVGELLWEYLCKLSEEDQASQPKSKEEEDGHCHQEETGSSPTL